MIVARKKLVRRSLLMAVHMRRSPRVVLYALIEQNANLIASRTSMRNTSGEGTWDAGAGEAGSTSFTEMTDPPP
jgi:hypothetical protein